MFVLPYKTNPNKTKRKNATREYPPPPPLPLAAIDLAYRIQGAPPNHKLAT